MNRRSFLKLSVVTASALALGPKALNASTKFDDYKALVRVHFRGGNDALNTFVPTGMDSLDVRGYHTYIQGRGTEISVSVSGDGLDTTFANREDLDFSGGNPYGDVSIVDAYRQNVYLTDNAPIGFNAVMPELFHLYQHGKAGIVLNIGSLTEDVTDKNRSAIPYPPFIEAHNHQTAIMATGQSDQISGTGWGGRVSDLMFDVNSESILSPLGIGISYGGTVRMLNGVRSRAILLKPNQTDSFWQIARDDKFIVPKRAFPEGRKAFLRSVVGASDRTNYFNNYLANLNQKSIDLIDVIQTQINADYTTAFTSVDPYGNEDLFERKLADQIGASTFDGDLIEQLEAVAKMIKYSFDRGMKRQIFDVELGGFDNHQDLLSNHPLRLREISLALWKFQKAMEDIGLSEQVTLFTTSDFGRTLKSNGQGTGHAWGGSNIIVGGAVRGGETYGELPDLTLGGPYDKDKSGRFIPSTSIEQYFATLSKWFGVTDEENLELFPNLRKFAIKDLEFMRMV